MRIQHVDGTYNLRDVGGYRTPAGTTKWGTLFRSDGLHRLTDTGRAEFAGLGITRVIDLRDDYERAHEPDALPLGVELLAHPIFPSAMAHVGDRLDIYSLTDRIFLDHADATVAAIGMIASADSPTLVHCTAGKDRTGAVVALTLAAVGVDRDDVFHDYAQTEEFLRGEWLERHLAVLRAHDMEITKEVLGLVSTSPIAAIEQTMKRIDSTYGSLESYLVAHGLEQSTLELLNERLVS